MVFTVEEETDQDDLSNEVCLRKEPEKITEISNFKNNNGG